MALAMTAMLLTSATGGPRPHATPSVQSTELVLAQITDTASSSGLASMHATLYTRNRTAEQTNHARAGNA